MASIVILGNRATTESLANMLTETEGFSRLVIAESVGTIPASDSKIIDAHSVKGAALMTEILKLSTSSKLLFVDARATASRATLAAMLKEIEDDTSSQAWLISTEAKSETIELSELSAEAAMKQLTGAGSWPNAAMAMKREFIERNINLHAESIQEFLTAAAIVAIGENEPISWTSESIRSDSESAKLSKAETARMLRLLVDRSNIEELFPAHDWIRYQGEAAAASYHSLAAIFLKLDEIEAATECLKLSDQFEDSPRSLALKGLIAERKGEILGAVANMVSSLQAYESRKKNEGESHYLTFRPKNIEVINEELRNGLQALNKRDNERAFNHFTEAVFSFDTFYRDFGVRREK